MTSYAKRIKLLLFTIILSATFVVAAFPVNTASALSGSDFNAGRIIDDSIFFDYTTMTAQDISAFFVSKVPSCQSSNPVCLRDYMVNVPAKSADAYCTRGISAGYKIAAQVVADVANACSINPKSLIVLLQKEQGLVTSTNPNNTMYRAATGYGCPDTAACDSEYYGFFNQVYNAGRQFQRYAKQANLFAYKAGRNNNIQYNPNSGCGSTTVYIQNQATAGLYNYTPYVPNSAALNNLYGTGDGCSAYGNRNFWRIFTDWFGTTLDGKCGYTPGAPTTGVTFRSVRPGIDQANFVIYEGSSTDCIESHTWNVGLGSWASNVATNLQSGSPANGIVLYGDIDGNGVDEPIYVAYNQTGSGKVEFHVWNSSMKGWSQHIISNLSAGPLNNGKIVFADVNNDGRDEPVLILFSGTGSGKVEFHVWNNDIRSWRWQVATQISPINTSDGTIDFGNVDGNRGDEAVLIGYRNQGSGKVEFHTWAPGWQTWRFNTASNQASIDPSNGFIMFADVDGQGIDKAVLVGTKNTGSGRIEFHTWNVGVTSWKYHTASNQPSN